MSENNENEGVLNGGFGPCNSLYDQFSNCMTFGGQLRQIRRDGTVENCGDLIMDYTRCLRASITHDENKKREIFLNSNTYQNSEKVIYPKNDILIPKDKPSWE